MTLLWVCESCGECWETDTGDAARAHVHRDRADGRVLCDRCRILSGQRLAVAVVVADLLTHPAELVRAATEIGRRLEAEELEP